MALVPTRQFHFRPPAAVFFDSLQSYSNHKGIRLHLFRYSSSIHFRKHVFFGARNKLDAEPLNEQNPSRNSNFVDRSLRCSESSVSSNRWLDKWSENYPQSHPKPQVLAVDYGSSESDSDLGYSESYGRNSNVRSGRRDGVGGRTMEEIVEKLKKFGRVNDSMQEEPKDRLALIEKGSVEDIFRVEEGMLPNTRGGFSKESSLEIGIASEEVRFPWEKPKEGEENSVRRKSRTSLAELTLPESELRRLKRLTFEKKHKTRIGGAGVTQAVVDMIHERWKTSEIVRLKFDGDAALNMRRIHEILEVCLL